MPCLFRPYERDLLAARDAGGEVANDVIVVVALVEMFELENVLARGPLLLELDEGTGNIRFSRVRSLAGAQLLCAAIAPWLDRVPGSEARNEFV